MKDFQTPCRLSPFNVTGTLAHPLQMTQIGICCCFVIPLWTGLKTRSHQCGRLLFGGDGVSQASRLGDGAAGQRRLLSVVLGASSESARATRKSKLLSWGYTAYEPVRLAQAGRRWSRPRCEGRRSVKLGLPEGWWCVLQPERQKQLKKARCLGQTHCLHHCKKGQAVGHLKVMQPDGTIVIASAVKVLGRWKKRHLRLLLGCHSSLLGEISQR